MKPGSIPPFVQPDPNDPESCLLHIKAVPGAKRDEIAGPLGDRLKVRISAPPEGGKANKAICELIARTLGIRTNAVSVLRGQTAPEKSVAITGLSASEAANRLT